MRFITNVQNICKLQSFTYKHEIFIMRSFLFLILIVSFISCEKNETNDILPDYNFNITVNLNLPEFINLNTPSGWANANGAIQGVIIQNTGIGNPPFKAFERACPNYDCTTPMTFDGSLKMKCSCDKSEYSIYDGSPQTSGNNHFAREYRVTQNGSILNITNF
ncbi:hypothetical protein [Lutibacter citreus]|uniref:hypothetical protein n=1 Tax=Lutibacter citreus TaxID=2138210 RepID=UPI0013007889|nr:hypothetical protein [Lutibacter citreus]